MTVDRQQIFPYTIERLSERQRPRLPGPLKGVVEPGRKFVYWNRRRSLGEPCALTFAPIRRGVTNTTLPLTLSPVVGQRKASRKDNRSRRRKVIYPQTVACGRRCLNRGPAVG